MFTVYLATNGKVHEYEFPDYNHAVEFVKLSIKTTSVNFACVWHLHVCCYRIILLGK